MARRSRDERGRLPRFPAPHATRTRAHAIILCSIAPGRRQPPRPFLSAMLFPHAKAPQHTAAEPHFLLIFAPVFPVLRPFCAPNRHNRRRQPLKILFSAPSAPRQQIPFAVSAPVTGPFPALLRPRPQTRFPPSSRPPDTAWRYPRRSNPAPARSAR